MLKAAAIPTCPTPTSVTFAPDVVTGAAIEDIRESRVDI